MPRKGHGGASLAPPIGQHAAHAPSNCTLFLRHSVLQPELALSPKSCHDCPGHTCLCMGLHPWPWSRKQRCCQAPDPRADQGSFLGCDGFYRYRRWLSLPLLWLSQSPGRAG